MAEGQPPPAAYHLLVKPLHCIECSKSLVATNPSVSTRSGILSDEYIGKALSLGFVRFCALIRAIGEFLTRLSRLSFRSRADSVCAVSDTQHTRSHSSAFPEADVAVLSGKRLRIEGCSAVSGERVSDEACLKSKESSNNGFGRQIGGEENEIDVETPPQLFNGASGLSRRDEIAVAGLLDLPYDVLHLISSRTNILPRKTRLAMMYSCRHWNDMLVKPFLQETGVFGALPGNRMRYLELPCSKVVQSMSASVHTEFKFSGTNEPSRWAMAAQDVLYEIFSLITINSFLPSACPIHLIPNCADDELEAARVTAESFLSFGSVCRGWKHVADQFFPISIFLSGGGENIAKAMRKICDRMDHCGYAFKRVRDVWINFEGIVVGKEDVELLRDFLRKFPRLETLAIHTSRNAIIHRGSVGRTGALIENTFIEFANSALKIKSLAWHARLMDATLIIPKLQHLQHLSIHVLFDYCHLSRMAYVDSFELGNLTRLRIIFPYAGSKTAFKLACRLRAPQLRELILEGDTEMSYLSNILQVYGKTVLWLELSYGQSFDEGWCLALGEVIDPALCPKLTTIVLPGHKISESICSKLPNVTRLGLRSDYASEDELPLVGEVTLRSLQDVRKLLIDGLLPSLRYLKLLHEQFPDPFDQTHTNIATRLRNGIAPLEEYDIKCFDMHGKHLTTDHHASWVPILLNLKSASSSDLEFNRTGVGASLKPRSSLSPGLNLYPG
ncbi:hypothetical protein SCHPADRAFT_896820 [Schizopora paradoxa]|uniref:F-box domain-containing protein n=1 Tax=Schizopora paradoxa TaxID=27342 RepID=A0A0H2QYS5_9AGAM|nr:hypothetical protein SCHPADRAFT_896820 [Schizopora paradoxa]